MKFAIQKYFYVFMGVGMGYTGMTKFKLTYYFVFGFINVQFNNSNNDVEGSNRCN
jgi:hypothetical protein